MNTRSIRFRLVFWYAGLLAGVFLILGFLMYASLNWYLEHSIGQTQTRRARQIADTLLARVDTTGEAHVIDEINSWFDPAVNDRFIRVTRGDGSVLYVSRNPKDGSFDATNLPLLREAAREGNWRSEITTDHKTLLIAAVPCQTPDGKRFVVEVGASIEPMQAFMKRLLSWLGAGLAAMMVVAVAGGYILVRNALAPVERITLSAEQITLHNLKDRLPIAKTGDELERLSVSLNNMIARLEDAFQQNRRFLADASHEMRTPLTIMRGELERLVEETHFNPEAQRSAASVLEEVERLARIVEGLFAISRLDAGEAQQEFVRFDLAPLAAATAEQICLLAEDKGITITCEASDQVLVEGDRARMKQVVVNLLDNAIKYTPEGGKVRLAVGIANGRAFVEVEDNGIGIPAAAQPHIFERFFRVDKARSREAGGAGLGLSIVRSICAAHGGRVEFQSEEGRGSRFRVELPLPQKNEGRMELENGKSVHTGLKLPGSR